MQFGLSFLQLIWILSEWKEKYILVSSSRWSWKQSFWFHRLIWGIATEHSSGKNTPGWEYISLPTARIWALFPLLSQVERKVKSCSPWLIRKPRLLLFAWIPGPLIKDEGAVFQNRKKVLYFMDTYQSSHFLYHFTPSINACIYLLTNTYTLAFSCLGWLEIKSVFIWVTQHISPEMLPFLIPWRHTFPGRVYLWRVKLGNDEGGSMAEGLFNKQLEKVGFPYKKKMKFNLYFIACK